MRYALMSAKNPILLHDIIYRWLFKLRTAMRSCAGFSWVSLTKVEPRKSFLFTKSSLVQYNIGCLLMLGILAKKKLVNTQGHFIYLHLLISRCSKSCYFKPYWLLYKRCRMNKLHRLFIWSLLIESIITSRTLFIILINRLVCYTDPNAIDVKHQSLY